MEKIKKINSVIVGIPIVCGLIGILIKGFLVFGLLFTMITGFVQVLLGIYLAFNKTENKHYKLYLLFVLSFFIICLILDKSRNKTYIFPIIITIPTCLCLYLSVLIYSKKEKL